MSDSALAPAADAQRVVVDSAEQAQDQPEVSAAQTSIVTTAPSIEISPSDDMPNGHASRVPRGEVIPITGDAAAAPASLNDELQDIPLASAAPTPEPELPPKVPAPRPPPETPAKDPPRARPNLNQSTTSLASVPSPDRRASTPSRSSVQFPGGHSRQSSTATMSLSAHLSSAGASAGPQLSTVLIIPGLQTIAQSKEAKRSPALLQAANRALELCQSNEAFQHPRAIFEPLRLACETRVDKLVIPSLDLLAKLISHAFFQEPHGPPPGEPPLADLIAHSITISYVEASPSPVALQVIKALLALVLSPTVLVHQSSLLKAVRTVYNVFLLSPDSTNQMVAQGGLTQMVRQVFGRVPGGRQARAAAAPIARRASSMSGPASEAESELASAQGGSRRALGPADSSLTLPTPASDAAEGGNANGDGREHAGERRQGDDRVPETPHADKDRLTL